MFGYIQLAWERSHQVTLALAVVLVVVVVVVGEAQPLAQALS